MTAQALQLRACLWSVATMQEAEPRPRSRSRLLLAGCFLAVSIVEFTLGWRLPGMGQSLGGPLLIVLGCAVGLFFLALWLVEVLSQSKEEMLKTQRTLLIGSVILLLLAGYWTVEWVLPIRVASENVRLAQLAERAMTVRVSGNTSCLLGPRPFASVPGFAGIDKVCRYPGMVMLSEGSENTGLLYLRRGTLQESGICARHLDGRWWEWADAEPDCPLGMGFFPSG